MKKSIVFLFSAFVALFFVSISCDDANSTSDGTIQGIFTVNRNFLYPEMQDSFYRVDPGDISAFDLNEGDRAFMTLQYEIDNTMGSAFAKWSLKSVEEKLSVSALTAIADVDTVEFSSPVVGLSEMLVATPSPVVQSDLVIAADWYWNKKQNFNLFFYGNGSVGDFQFSPMGVSKDTLCFALNSKIAKGDEPTIQLVTFDLSNVRTMLSAKDAGLLAELDSFCINVTTKVLDPDKNVVKILTFSNGKKYKNDL